MKNKKPVIIFSPLHRYIPDSELSFSGLKMPLAALAISALLDQEGYNIKIITGTEKDYLSKITKLIQQDPICVGISCMTGFQILNGIKVSKLIRELNNSIPIIWGGFHPSIMPEQTARSPYVDFVVRGYGERTFFELVKAIEYGNSFDKIKGLTFLKGDNVINTDERPLEDLNIFPPTPYHLINVPHFFSQRLGKRSISYCSSRGCPNDCSFCADKIVYKRRWNPLTAERVVDELNNLKIRYNIDSVIFDDTNFAVNEKRIQSICKGMIEKKLELRWGSVNATAKTLANLSEETWGLLQEAGCYSFLVGAESGYQKALDKLNKNSTLEDLIKASRLSEKYNIKIVYSFMLGIPIDLTDYYNQRYHFLKELEGTLGLINKLINNSKGQPRILLFRFTLYPGCALYEECKKFGWPEPDSLEEWGNCNFQDSKMPWLTDEEIKIIDHFIELFNRTNPPLRDSGIYLSALLKRGMKELYKRYF